MRQSIRDERSKARFEIELTPGCLVNPNLLVLSILRSVESRATLNEYLERAGHKLVQAVGCEQARILLENGVEPDLVILEPTQSANLSGLESILRASSNASICLLQSARERQARSQASAFGVRFFLQSPLIESEVLSMLDRVSSPLCREREGLPIAEPNHGTSEAAEVILEELGDGRYFLAAAPSMLKIYRQVQLLADVDAPVLILGESGTGKEVIAHLIHAHSRRASHRFVNVNCAALPADLLESELFGYQQGAFTGAIKDKPGKFEQANRGTLLLDEIGEMSAQMQAKLLHVLQDGQFNRLGARESSRTDVRVLAATNVQIEDALVGKTFREDLFYRLNVFTINVPPLRERREEIPSMVAEIIRRFPEALRKGSESAFPSRLLDAMLLYDWRGNVRELRNFVTRTITMRDAETAIRELEKKIAAEARLVDQEPSRPPHARKTGMRTVVRDMKDRAEAQMIQDALEVSRWNRRHAAKYLEISYRGLLYKIQQHGLSPGSVH
jgi:two-component system, NtrC family, response regulator AtoC